MDHTGHVTQLSLSSWMEVKSGTVSSLVWAGHHHTLVGEDRVRSWSRLGWWNTVTWGQNKVGERQE